MHKTKPYLSHISAAIDWDIPYLHVVFGYPSKEALIASQTHEHWSYPHPDQRRAQRNRIVHVCTRELPGNALCLRQGTYVASPELVFLDLSKKLSFHQSLLLGMQLCSTSPHSKIALTTTRKLHSFLTSCSPRNSNTPAMKAVRFLSNNSWSIMESLLYLQLTLPNQYGGFGLSGAQLNHEITLKDKGDWQKTNRVTADLYWKKARLVVEYDSYEFHNAINSWVRDARRSATLERNGYKTISINSAQMYNDAAMTEIAQVIARHLNERLRIRTSNYSHQKDLLRSLLPSGKLCT